MLTVNELYDLSHSLAGDYLKQFTYPWEALAGISDLILEIGKQLPEDEYVHPTDWDGNVLEDVWVAKDATVFKTAYLHGPCIIGHRTEVRQCAFIRGSALVGNDCVVEAGLNLTAGTKVSVLPHAGVAPTVEGYFAEPVVVAASELSGVSDVIFRRNSQSGRVEALPRAGKEIKLPATSRINP